MANLHDDPIGILPPDARFVLRLAPASLVSPAVARLHLNLPINRSISRAGRTTARLGPDEWLLIGPAHAAETIERHISEALSGVFFSLVAIVHRDVAVAVGGPSAREIVQSTCPLDLREAAFPPQSATRTLLGRAGVVLLRPDIEPTYRLECGRSFGPYVCGLLREVARGRVA